MHSPNRFPRIAHLLSTAVVALALVGCDTPDSEFMPVADEAAVAEEHPAAAAKLASAAPNTTIAELQLPGAASLRFIDLGDGEIGLLEGRDPTQKSWMVKMITEHQSTPLELYLAAAGDDDVVLDRLQAHHDGVAKHAPRELAAPPEVQEAAPDFSLNGFHDANNLCDVLHWDDAWAADLDPVSQYIASDFRVQEVDNDRVTFYPGSANNTATWIGACADDQGAGCGSNAYDDRLFYVDKLVSGAWQQVLAVTIDAKIYGTGCNVGFQNSAYTFYSNNPNGARFRGRLIPYWGGVCDACYDESFGFAVAYTKSAILGG